MKQKIIFSFSLLILIISLYRVTKPGNKENEQMTSFNVNDSFIIGATDNAWQNNNDTLVSRLKHNVWHKYSHEGFGWRFNGASGDSLYADSTAYYNQVKSVINSNASQNISTTMDRGKISLLAWSQRSDYQCEETLSDNDYWFYGYNTHSDINMQDVTDNSQHGDGERVRRCYPHPSGPEAAHGWIVKNLIANREQINRDWWYELNDSIGAWHIKPRIRIDPVFANDPGNFNVNVCKIIVLNFDGDTIRQLDLKVNNFIPEGIIYNGDYIEEYFRLSPNDSNLIIEEGSLFNPDKEDLGDMSCQVDFRVWYYGNCEMWIDRVRVENEVANRLLSGNDFDFENWLRWECNLAMENPDYIWNFYIEEFEFNNLPSIKYVNEKIEDYTGNRFSLMVNLNYDLFKIHIPNSSSADFTAEKINKYLFDSTGIETWWNVSYALEGWEEGGYLGNERRSFHPTTLSESYYDSDSGILSYPVSVNLYEDTLQWKLDFGEGGGGYTKIMKLSDSISKINGKPVINLMQTHLWFSTGHKLKEPTNEELEMLSMLPVSYGAKGIIFYTYSSLNNMTDNYYYRGIIEPGTNPVTPRYKNVYRQEKWSKLKEISTKLKNLGPAVMSFDNANRKSYVYRLERSSLSDQTYINQLKAYLPAIDAPDTSTDVSDLTADLQDNTYLQASVFKNPDEEQSEYFMLVNRRCSPYINNSSTENIGGRRILTIKIDSTGLHGFNNWKIINMEDYSVINTFAKNSNQEINLGIFNPGEGKLYKIAPVMQEGGELVADEDCGGFEFDCTGEVNNNGKNVNIKPGTTINFTNSSARIIMTGGNFKSGITPSENTAPVYLQGKNGSLWKGLHFSECGDVEIERTYFENISPYPVDSTYAAEMIDCEYINISYSSFRAELDIKTGGILINYTSSLRAEEVYINYNHFEMDAGELPALSVITSGYVTFPMIIEGNEFVSFTGNSSNAMLVSGVEGGAIKNNQLSGYKNGIILIWSMMDIYGNSIDGDYEDSRGVLSYASSNANLAPDGSIYTGGFNMIACEGENAKCIDADNSFLLLDNGYNTFDLKNYEPGDAYHLSGTISDEAYADPLDAGHNCFKVTETDTEAVHNMTWTSEEPINFNFQNYSCNEEPPSEYLVYELGNGMNDTIYTESGGSGGGISNDQLSIINDQLEKNVEIVSVESLEDSVSINIRKRNYQRVSELCYELLTDYIDSLDNAGTITKLYLAELRLDSSNNRISNLKSFLETIILENPGKESLIKQSFYLIQKCKVSMGLYQSAMSGFQEIINQNPYSYEGLLASWDFSATSLLNSLHGSGSGMKSYEFQITSDEFAIDDDEIIINKNKSKIVNPKSKILDDDPNEKYDKKTFTKEDRKLIKENTLKAFESSREKEIKEIKSLESKIREGKASESEKSEYNTKIVLSEIIKVKNPKDITEHIKFVNDDIQKIFESGKGKSTVEVINIIPAEYSLQQNYPNPFNPVTRIKFSLPEESSVKLTVYDILGREVKKLVNEKLSIGRYEYEFNGSNFSSGVYFYILRAGVFVQTKRMVLIK